MNMDELDQAISALPFEEPPAGLRASILLATAYRPAPAFSMLELAAIGAMGAVATLANRPVDLGRRHALRAHDCDDRFLPLSRAHESRDR